ncbi:MAG: hypothetical protein F4Z58_13385 [Acidimicrobiaceae bacterium]|nr:hypothetical protein [Acidimicrobiaceae bacterium]MYD05667.1 hypothetical protein [Acidimicrobiaceae bacterium]MYI57692.1 hypothetical protein [Acidimicrobiaceae bacterium]
MRRLWLVVLVAASLLAASCGSGSDDDGEEQVSPTDPETTEPETPDSTATDTEDSGAGTTEAETSDSSAGTGGDGEDESAPEPEPMVLTSSWTGVTPETIKVGVAGIDFTRLQEFGVDIEGIVAEIWAPAWVDAFNRRGGAHGRMVEVVVRNFLPVGNIESDAVCAELTEDEEVFVVLGAMLGDNPLCVTQLHETPYVGMFGLTAERAEKSIAPFFASEMAADLQRSNSTKALISERTFDGARLAVFWEIADDPVANNVVLPLLEEAGVNVVAKGTLLDFAGDTQASEAAIDVIFENFAAAGADMYLNISGLVPFNRSIDRNRPGVPFVLLNGQLTNSAIIATSGYDPDILMDAIGVTASKPTLEEWFANDDWNVCVDEINAYFPGTIDIDSIPEAVVEGIGQACQGFRLLEHLLIAAGPDLTPDALIEAADNTGELLLPGMIAGSLGPGKYSVGDVVRFYTYDIETKNMLPDGDPIVVTR